MITHDGKGVFAGLPQPFEATRYHSLVIERESCPDALEVTAHTPDGEIMGVRHRELPIEGLQFHPESILTAAGKDLLNNFLERCRAATDLPLAVGFGISRREDVKYVTGKADIAVVGTGTIQLVQEEGPGAVGPFLSGLR